MRLLRRNAPSVPAALQRSASASNARFSPAEYRRRLAIATTSGSGGAAALGIPSLALRAPSRMPRAEAEGVLFIEESVSDAMSDTTLDCKLSKADVSGHIGTGGREFKWILDACHYRLIFARLEIW